MADNKFTDNTTLQQASLPPDQRTAHEFARNKAELNRSEVRPLPPEREFVCMCECVIVCDCVCV